MASWAIVTTVSVLSAMFVFFFYLISLLSCCLIWTVNGRPCFCSTNLITCLSAASIPPSIYLFLLFHLFLPPPLSLFPPLFVRLLPGCDFLLSAQCDMKAGTVCSVTCSHEHQSALSTPFLTWRTKCILSLLVHCLQPGGVQPWHYMNGFKGFPKGYLNLLWQIMWLVGL